VGQCRFGAVFQVPFEALPVVELAFEGVPGAGHHAAALAVGREPPELALIDILLGLEDAPNGLPPHKLAPEMASAGHPSIPPPPKIDIRLALKHPVPKPAHSEPPLLDHTAPALRPAVDWLALE
jgi:hypothetical protein